MSALQRQGHGFPVGHFLAALLVVGLSPLAGAPSMADDRRDVTILLRSEKNKAVNADIFRKLGAGDWELLQEGAYAEFTIRQVRCDQTVVFSAKPASAYYKKRTDEPRSCTRPRIVFDDFVANPAAGIDLDKLRDADVWAAALGGGPDATAQGQQIAKRLEDALGKGDYGSVAIVGAELAAQMAILDNASAKMFFRALAVDATARGALAAKNAPIEAFELTTMNAFGGMVLSPKAQKAIADYQRARLGYKPTTPSLGTADWKTMRSLPGGSDVLVRDVQLPDDAARSLKVEAFLME